MDKNKQNMRLPSQLSDYQIQKMLPTDNPETKVYVAKPPFSLFQKKDSNGNKLLTYCRQVAIKCIPHSEHHPVLKYLHQCEIKALTTLQSTTKHIVKIYDIINPKGNSSFKQTYVVMQYFQRGTLKHYIQKRNKANNPLTQSQILKLFRMIVQGYQAMIDNLILHRDIKPSNVMMRDNGELALIDFGYAQVLLAQNKPIIKYNVGSPSYMAPEAYSKCLFSEKSDIWSIGMTLVQMLTGKTLDFDHKTQQTYFDLLMKQEKIQLPVIKEGPYTKVIKQLLQITLDIKAENRATCQKLKYIIDKALVFELNIKAKIENLTKKKIDRSFKVNFLTQDGELSESISPTNYIKKQKQNGQSSFKNPEKSKNWESTRQSLIMGSYKFQNEQKINSTSTDRMNNIIKLQAPKSLLTNSDKTLNYNFNKKKEPSSPYVHSTSSISPTYPTINIPRTQHHPNQTQIPIHAISPPTISDLPSSINDNNYEGYQSNLMLSKYKIDQNKYSNTKSSMFKEKREEITRNSNNISQTTTALGNVGRSPEIHFTNTDNNSKAKEYNGQSQNNLNKYFRSQIYNVQPKSYVQNNMESSITFNQSYHENQEKNMDTKSIQMNIFDKFQTKKMQGTLPIKNTETPINFRYNQGINSSKYIQEQDIKRKNYPIPQKNRQNVIFLKEINNSKNIYNSKLRQRGSLEQSKSIPAHYLSPTNKNVVFSYHH